MVNLRPRTLSLLLLPIFSGCEEAEPTQPEPDPIVEPTPVPAAPPIVDATSLCTPLLEGERLAAVSPEGHAWLLRENGEGQLLRVVDGFSGALVVVERELEIDGVEDLVAWSGDTASVVSPSGLFEIEDGSRVSLTAPQGFDAADARACGLLSENGFVVSGGAVSELREDGQWWTWSPTLAGGDRAARLASIGGECQDRGNHLWLASDGGAFFDVSSNLATVVATFEGWTDSAATDAHLFVLEGDLLHVGPADWVSYRFGGTPPTALASSGAHAYFTQGSRILRTDGASFEEIAHEASAVDAVLPHAAGVFTVGGGEVCDVRIGSSVRFHDVRPHQRTTSEFLPFAVEVALGQPAPTVTLDGDEVTLSEAEGLHGAELELEEVGWHEVVAISGDATRSIWVKRVPSTVRSFEEDVAPLYAATCAGSQCHGDKSLDLSTVEAWRENAQNIKARVVDAKTMPPPSNTPADWDDEEIRIIAEWLEGGMLQ